MSAFLAPIHFWMYDKILIAQKLTFAVEEKFLNTIKNNNFITTVYKDINDRDRIAKLIYDK